MATIVKSSPTTQLEILGVGHASFTSVNRRFYRALIAHGLLVELVVPSSLPGNKKKVADTAEIGDPVIHWTEIKGKNNRFWEFTRLVEILNQRQPRIIYLENDPASIMAIQIGQWASKNNAALICYINENNLPTVRDSFNRKDVRNAIRTLRFQMLAFFSRKNIHTIFAICQDGVEAMSRIGMMYKTRLMPLGYDTSIFYKNEPVRSRIRQVLGLNKPTIAYFGRVIHIKGVHILIDALFKIHDLEWQFLIDEFTETGATPYSTQIRERLEKTPWLSDRIVTFNSSHTDMPLYMNACDIAVLPSIWKEQYGRVIPEAMGCGRAVVVSDAGALPELVGDAGIIVAKNDSDALAEALRKLLLNPDKCKSLGEQALKRATDKLSIEAQIKSIKPTLEEILGRQLK